MLTVARVGTNDLTRAQAFYDPIAALAGAALAYDRPDMIAYKGKEGAMLLIGRPLAGEASVGNGSQVGFTVDTRAAVDALHARALELGGTDAGAPGVRGDDPDGNKLVVFRYGPP